MTDDPQGRPEPSAVRPTPEQVQALAEEVRSWVTGPRPNSPTWHNIADMLTAYAALLGQTCANGCRFASEPYSDVPFRYCTQWQSGVPLTLDDGRPFACAGYKPKETT